MTDRDALAGFAALSHPVRLMLFRELASCAPQGVPAGQLAERFDVPPSTMTGHLQSLERAGLLSSERRSRSILYALNMTGARSLVDYLVHDCCAGRSDICGPAGSVEPLAMQEAS
ncbi:ArsR/SmtB family transcription factor [Maricaulis sp. D1M11]|uniref:ArsR/SmtB family transcription factor n=1 Tax=Maricaulis sp. D1M11 TaxID=3076117 RepID=UPI0039B601ED